MVIPPRSPFGLLQEDLWPDQWLILVSCIMLNCTSRKQVERVLPEFVKRWPTAASFMDADDDEIVEVCRSLGFANRRTKILKKMTEHYLATNWNHASELPGVGEYAARTWEIFCQNKLGDDVPNDHALTKYWQWRRERS